MGGLAAKAFQPHFVIKGRSEPRLLSYGKYHGMIVEHEMVLTRARWAILMHLNVLFNHLKVSRVFVDGI